MKRTLFHAGLILLAAGAIVGCATRTVGTGKSFDGPLGLQLYSLRASFADDVPATLAKVHEFGFKYVELAGTYNMRPEQFRELLQRYELVPISGHFPYDRYKTDPEGVARDAKALGLQYAGCAWIPHEGAFDEKEARDAAEVFNRAGAVLARHGIQFFYHIHGYEFQPHGQGTLFDLLVAETDPKLANYQIDVFWVQHPGHDPARLIEKYPSRFVSMHIKDMKKGLKGDLTGRSNPNNDVAVGTGQMDWPAILAAAERANIKWYFIEDESDDVEAHIPQSLEFLETVRY